MPAGYNSLKKKLILPAVAFVLGLTATLVILLNWQLNNIARTQQQELGNTLVRQLAELSQMPLSRGDIISLQVVLDNLVTDSSAVALASAFDRDRRLLAQSRSQSTPEEPLIAFERPVSFEKNSTGSVRVELLDQTRSAPYRNLLLLVAVTCGLSGLALLFWQGRTVSDISVRLNQINNGLLSSPQEERGMDEITLLETRVAPLLTHAADEDSESEQRFHCLVAVCCHNLPRLKLQLSSEHFEALFRQLDELIDQACRLYEGLRLTTFKNCLVVQFSGSSEIDDHPLRALYFARAITSICQEWAPASGVPMELSMVLDNFETPPAESAWIRGLALEQSTASLVDATGFSGPWEILIRQQLAETDILAECVDAELLGGEPRLARFRRLAEPQTNLLMRQVAFLQTQI